MGALGKTVEKLTDENNLPLSKQLNFIGKLKPLYRRIWSLRLARST
jgi:hypothetical protein